MADEGTFNRGIKITQKEYKSNLNLPEKSQMVKLKEAGEKAVNFYRTFDLYGRPINLKYNGQDVYKSVIGATITLSAVVGILIYFTTSLVIFLGRQSPIFSSISEYQAIPSAIEIDKFTDLPMDWIVGLDIFSNGGSVFDPRVFDITVKRMSLVQGEEDSMYTYDVIPANCTSSSTFMSPMPTSTTNETYYDYFRMATDGVETAFCFYFNKFMDYNTGQSFNTTLSGTPTEDQQEYISIEITVCDNSTKTDSSSMCLSLEEIKNKLDYYNVRYYFTEQLFITNQSLQNPVINSTAFFSFPIQQYFSKTYTIYVQNNTVSDTWNIFTINPTIKHIFSYTDEQLNIDFVDTGININKPLLVINFMVDTTNQTFQRKYSNIKDFFVSIVSIMNGIWTGGAAIGRFFNGMLLRVDLINKSFFLIQDETDEKDLKKSKESNSQVNKEKVANIKANMEEMKEIKAEPDNKSVNDKTNRSFLHKGDKNKEIHSIISKKESDNSDLSNLEDSFEKDANMVDPNKDPYSEKKYIHGNLVNPYYNDEKMKLPVKRRKFDKFKMSFSELIQQMLPCCKNRKNIKVKKKILEDCGSIIESFFDIERIVSILREYQDLRNVVLSPEEYKILKQLTTPKIEIIDDEVIIKKVDKINVSEKELKKNYNQFVSAVNRLIMTPSLSHIEYNLLEIHKLSHCDKKYEKLKNDKLANDAAIKA